MTLLFLHCFLAAAFMNYDYNLWHFYLFFNIQRCFVWILASTYLSTYKPLACWLCLVHTRCCVYGCIHNGCRLVMDISVFILTFVFNHNMNMDAHIVRKWNQIPMFDKFRSKYRTQTWEIKHDYISEWVWTGCQRAEILMIYWSGRKMGMLKTRYMGNHCA